MGWAASKQGIEPEHLFSFSFVFFGEKRRPGREHDHGAGFGGFPCLYHGISTWFLPLSYMSSQCYQNPQKASCVYVKCTVAFVSTGRFQIWSCISRWTSVSLEILVLLPIWKHACQIQHIDQSWTKLYFCCLVGETYQTTRIVSESLVGCFTENSKTTVSRRIFVWFQNKDLHRAQHHISRRVSVS